MIQETEKVLAEGCGDFGGHGLSETIAFQAKLTNNQERLCLTQRIPALSFSNEVPGNAYNATKYRERWVFQVCLGGYF